MILLEAVVSLGSDLEWMGPSEGATPASPPLPSSTQQALQALVLASGTAGDDDAQSPPQDAGGDARPVSPAYGEKSLEKTGDGKPASPADSDDSPIFKINPVDPHNLLAWMSASSWQLRLAPLISQKTSILQTLNTLASFGAFWQCQHHVL